jgi:NDP-sugar pyrophosphorylase family protein
MPMTIHNQSTTTVILGTVEAVVMAAGQGTRLRPLTERYAKPVLPIDGRPVIVTLLHELSFVERVIVVVGHLGHQVRALLHGFPGELRFVEQPEALGSGDAVARAEATPPYLVLAADTVFRRGAVERFAAVEAEGAIAVRKAPAPDPVHRHGVGVEDGRVVRFHDESSEWSGAPLWLVGKWIHERVLERPGSPPWELGTAFQLAVDAGLDVRAVEIGPTRDLTHPFDLVAHNVPYSAALLETSQRSRRARRLL